jgi:hypothetical protein
MDGKEAIAIAKKELRLFFAEEDAKDLQLEEILSDNFDWVITLSFYRNKQDGYRGDLASILPMRWARENKVVRISKKTGQLRSIKNYVKELA